jgi:hypothetical protein
MNYFIGENSNLEEALAEGYQAMADENLEIAEAYLPLFKEIL